MNRVLPENFWEGVEPGFFLQSAVESEAKAHPGHSVSVVSESLGAICGFVPADWHGGSIKLRADDVKCGLTKEN